MEIKKPDIESSWYEVLKQEFEEPYFYEIKSFLIQEKRQYIVYPPSQLIFNAFNLTPFDKVNLIIAYFLSFCILSHINIFLPEIAKSRKTS